MDGGPRRYNTFNSSSSSTNSIFEMAMPFPSSPYSMEGGGESVVINVQEIFNTGTHSKMTPMLPMGTKALEGASKVCLQCKKMFKDTDDKGCRFHKGKYTTSENFAHISSASLKRWTCCKKEAGNAEGCAWGFHKEDSRMSGILNTFNVLAVDDDQQEEAASEEGPKKVKKVKKKKKRGQVQHAVQRNDTLHGLSLQYNVSMQDIKKANKLFSDAIFARKVLIIPPEP